METSTRDEFLSLQPWWLRLAFRSEPYRLLVFIAAIGLAVGGSLIHVESVISLGIGLLAFVWLPLRLLGIPARLARQANPELDL